MAVLRSLFANLPKCFSWSDRNRAVSILAGVNIFYLVYLISGQNLLQLVASLTYYGLIVSVVYASVFRLIYSQNKTPENSENKEFVSQAQVQQGVIKITSLVNSMKNFFAESTQSYNKLFQFIIVCYIVEFISSLFSFGTLLWLVINLLYVGTFLIEVKRIQICDYLEVVITAPVDVVQLAFDSIPKYENHPHHHLTIGHANKNDEKSGDKKEKKSGDKKEEKSEKKEEKSENKEEKSEEKTQEKEEKSEKKEDEQNQSQNNTTQDSENKKEQ